MLLLPLLSSILGIPAFLPFNLWLFGFVFLVPLFIFFIKENRFWRLVLGVFIFRFIFALGMVYYTLEPITWILSLLIFSGLAILIFAVKKITARNSILNTQYPILVLLPFLWTFFDHLQARYSLLPTYIITAGNSLGSSPFSGLAAFGGLTTLTFSAALINILIAAVILKYLKLRNFDFRLSGIILIVLFFGWQISQYALKNNLEEYNSRNNSFKIVVVSTNENFDKNQFEPLKKNLIAAKADFIVFPEDIFNNSLDSEQYAEFFKNLSNELNADVLVNFDTFDNVEKFNSSVLFDQNGEIGGIYNKRRLTFIGEYWPFGNWRPSFYDWLKEKNPEIKNYAVFNPQNSYFRGEKKLLSLSVKTAGGKELLFAAPICLEIHYPTDLKDFKKMGARLIVNQTSNRWINKGNKHFLYLTNNLKKIESIWLGLPIVSSGVKDFAGIIAPDGKTNLINFESKNKNYGIYFGEIKY